MGKKWIVDTPEETVEVEADRWFVGDFKILYFTTGERENTRSNAAFTIWNHVLEIPSEDNAR